MTGSPPIDWNAIASFYAGRPVTVSYALNNGFQGGTYGDGRIQLSPKIREHLDNLMRYRNDYERGPVLGTLGLSTLIHEALHNSKGMEGVGLLPASDETQAPALAGSLVGDALARFFGIGRGSKLWNRYMQAATNDPNYRTAMSSSRLPRSAEQAFWRLQPDDWIGPRLR